MIKKIKIVQVAHAVGGVDVSLRLNIKHLDPDTFEFIVVHGPNDTQLPYLNALGVPVHSHIVPITRQIGLQDVKGLYEFIKFVRQQKPDIIHGHSAKGGVYSRIASLFCSAKSVYTPHAFSYFSSENKWSRLIFLFIEKCLSKIGYIIAVSDSEKTRAVQEVGVPSHRVYMFSNPIEPIDKLSLTTNETFPDHFLCTIGRPSYQKNIELMIDVLHALNQLRPTHLVLLGVGHHADKLEAVKARIAQYQLQDKVKLFAWTDRETTLSILSLSKIYLSCARYEGLPFALVEAGALGIPSVVSDCDGNRDVIEDGYNGYVIQNHDVSSYVEKILVLDDVHHYNEISTHAKKRFDTDFNILRTIGQLEYIYKEILSK